MAYDKKCWTYIVLRRRPVDDLKRIGYTCEQYEVETSCYFTEMFISYSKIDRAEYVYFGIYASEQMCGQTCEKEEEDLLIKTEDYYLKRLIAIHDKYEVDIELNHVYSDELLVDILRDLGWDKLADEYESTYKWYA